MRRQSSAGPAMRVKAEIAVGVAMIKASDITYA